MIHSRYLAHQGRLIESPTNLFMSKKFGQDRAWSIGPYKTRNGAQRHNGAKVHQNLPKNYVKLGNNYGIWLELGLGLGVLYGPVVDPLNYSSYLV